MIDVGPTLGWDILDWLAEYMPSPSDASEPLMLTDEQAVVVLRWYELDDDGEFMHRRGRLEMAKGWGKSPLLAAVALVEFCGPAKFSGWKSQGVPNRGVPWHKPVVEIAAVSEDQTDNTYSALYEMLTANENRAATRLNIDFGRSRLYLKDRPGTLRPVTAASGSREGARLTFGVLDETHLWTRTNGGHRLANTLRRNAAKMDGRTFETTNAPIMGERSVAEESGGEPEPGVLHVARRPLIEPSLDSSEDELLEQLRYVYGDSHWAPLDRLMKEIADPATSWDDALRFYFNVRTAGVARAVDPRQWADLARPQDVPGGTLIGLGFDGSDYRDPTVLRACTADGYSFIIGKWVPTPERPIPRGEVMAAIRGAFARYTVGLLLADPPRWRDEIDRLALEYPERVLAFDTNQARRMAPAVDRWRSAVRGGTHTHDGDEFTSEQVRATRLKRVKLADVDDDRTMYMLEKDGHVGNDAAVADVLAYEAAMTMEAPPDTAQAMGDQRMTSEWDGTAWAGSAPVPAERAALSLNNWLEFFRFGSNAYFADSFTQTLAGTREDMPTTFAGYVEQIKKANAVAFAVMDVRRRLFSEARFTFRRLVDGRPGELFGGRDGRNPAYRGLALLSQPWAGATTRDLLTTAIDHVDTAGTAFIVRRANRIVFLRPDWVTVIVGSMVDDDVQAGDLEAELIGLVYHPGGRDSGRRPVTMARDEFVLWAPIKDPVRLYLGMSWLTPIIREILGDSATTNHKLKYFENGATPNLAVKLDADISLADAKDWIELFRQEHEGVMNAYRTLFLGGGATPVAVGSDMQQIDFKAIQGAGETRIAAAGGVPPIIVGLSEGLASATYSNYGQARRAFADLTMRPLWGGFCETIAPLITIPPDGELWYDDRDISFLQEDLKDVGEILKLQASAIQVLFNTGFLPDDIVDSVTANDLRRLKGKHTGLSSVQLQPAAPEEQPAEEEPATAEPAPTNGRVPAGVEV